MDRSWSATTERSHVRFPLTLGAVGATYFLAGKFGLAFFGLLNPSASAVWPPTGVAIAALILLGPRVWPAVFVGAFFVNVTTAGSILTSIGIAIGNTLEGLVAAYLVVRFAHGSGAFARALDIFKFAALAGLLSTLVSATLGVGVLTLGGYAPVAQFGPIWLTWWLGDTAGAIVVAPVILLWWVDRSFQPVAQRPVEALLLAATVIATSSALFFHPLLGRFPLAFLCMPALVWAAFRFTQREVVTAVALISLVATWATATGHGPFAMPTANESLLVLQAFMAMIAMTALVMSALVQERVALFEREHAALAESEAARRAGNAFFAMLSHELRNPLGAIAAASEVLDSDQVPPDAGSRALSVIRRQTAHLTRLIDDLLDVARVTAGKLSLRLERVDLAAAVEHCVQNLLSAGMTQAHRVDLKLERVWVDADPARLEQIVTNLLSNAAKHVHEGRIDVRIEVSGNDVVLRVEDSGAGIAADLLPRVFDLFAQGEQGFNRPRGFGVGLTVVRRLVELHGWCVEAHSDGVGRGSAFVVRLPRAAGSVRAGDLATAAPSGRRYRILLVEDNADTRESLRVLLENSGHEVHEAGDGSRGVRDAVALTPDFAVVDIGLPGTDGCEVARQIRAAAVGVRLIALTGYGRDEDRVRTTRAGFDAHLVKPVRADALGEIMDQLYETNPGKVA